MEAILTMPDLVRKVLEGLPDENPYSEAIERLQKLAKIEQQLDQSKVGTAHTQEEIGIMFRQWQEREKAQ